MGGRAAEQRPATGGPRCSTSAARSSTSSSIRADADATAAGASARADPPFEDAISDADWLTEDDEEGGASPAGAADTADAATPSTPSTPPPTTAADLTAHAAAFAGDVPSTLAALRALPAASRAAADPVHGNTPLQIAALRGHAPLVAALLESGLARATDRGARRWNALDEAALRGNTAITTLLARAAVAEAKASRAAARAGLAAALAGATDFSMEVRWEFGSPVLGPLLRAVAPHDTYRVWKVGSAVRIDGSLRGLDGPGSGGSGGGGGALPSWRRGPFSLVWHAPRRVASADGADTDTTELPATAWLIDRDRNSYVDLAEERRAALRESGSGSGSGGLDAAVAAASAAAGTRARLEPGPLAFTPCRPWHGLGRWAAAPPTPVRLACGFAATPFEAALPLAATDAERGCLDLGPGATWEAYLAAPPAPDTVVVRDVNPLAMAGMPGRGGGGGRYAAAAASTPSTTTRPLTAKVWLAGPDFPLSGAALAAVLELASAASPHLAPLGRFGKKAASAAAAAEREAREQLRRRRGGGEADKLPRSSASSSGGGGGGGTAIKFQVPLLLTVHADLTVLACATLGPGDAAVTGAAAWFGLPAGCRVKAAADLTMGRVVSHAAASAAAASQAGGGRGEGYGGGRSPHLARLIARRPRTESVLSSTVGDEYDELEF